jgi:hypothetical protein
LEAAGSLGLGYGFLLLFKREEIGLNDPLAGVQIQPVAAGFIRAGRQFPAA